MSTHKDEKTEIWYVMVRYHDWRGEKKQKCKRGFATKRKSTGMGTHLPAERGLGSGYDLRDLPGVV